MTNVIAPPGEGFQISLHTTVSHALDTMAHSSKVLLLAETYPGVGGLSGISWRNLSRDLLNVMGSLSVLMCFGVMLTLTIT